jgi:hypothetical protein
MTTQLRKLLKLKKTSDIIPKKVPEKKNSEAPTKILPDSIPRTTQTEVSSTS